MAECECDEGHTVSKLGHAFECPHYSVMQWTMIDASLWGCSNFNNHSDGTPHDFDWATHNDETTSTGVCRCGLRQIDYDMARMP
jgi:hypothetical protein